jgi:Bacteriocin-protection, YdeI or OmpD-Associated/Domain of unknown function (DUF1905)
MALNIPTVVSESLPARDKTSVEGTINGHPFRATLEPSASGTHVLGVNKAMHKGAGAEVGDTVKLIILVPEAEPAVPADLRAALAVSQRAKTFWKTITYMNRHDWIRWIDSVRTSETRARHIALAVEWLSSGKRTPCCFNTYEYMLNKVYADGDRPKNLYPKSARRTATTKS